MKLTDQLIALGGIFLVIILGFTLFFWLSPEPGAVTELTREQLVKPDSAMTGSMTARVTMVEWGDFECPSCATLEPVLKQIIAKYGQNPEFNFVFRNFPLPQHKNSRPAAEVAEAAGAQGRYWDMHALLYEHQDEWVKGADPRASFETYAKSLGLDLAAFNTAIDAKTYAPLVARDYQDANSLGINHTPTVFLNGVEQTDTTFSSLSKAIDAALQ